MADPVLVKQYLAGIEHDRETGRVTVPPPRLQPGNLLGGKTEAFEEAVRQQGQMLYKQQHPLAGDLPLSSTGGQMPTAPPGPPAQVGGAWSDAEAEQQRRAVNGGLRAPVLEALGLVKGPPPDDAAKQAGMAGVIKK